MWLGAIALITTALYMQYIMDMVPCALCMTQRVFIIVVGICALIAWLHNSGKNFQRLYTSLAMIFALIGGAFSSRHIWLQNLPEDLVPSCGPSLSYLMGNVPFLEALQVLLQGDGNCAETSWIFLGLTIPGWTLISFIGFFMVNAFIFYKSFR